MTINQIYAEHTDDGGDVTKMIFLSYQEAAIADHDAREEGGKLSGGLLLNVALNRSRHNRCMYCGVKIGEKHQGCYFGVINTTPRPSA